MSNDELKARLDHAKTNRSSIIDRWNDFDAEVYVRNTRRDTSQITRFVTELFETNRDDSLEARTALERAKALLR